MLGGHRNEWVYPETLLHLAPSCTVWLIMVKPALFRVGAGLEMKRREPIGVENRHVIRYQ